MALARYCARSDPRNVDVRSVHRLSRVTRSAPCLREPSERLGALAVFQSELLQGLSPGIRIFRRLVRIYRVPLHLQPHLLSSRFTAEKPRDAAYDLLRVSRHHSVLGPGLRQTGIHQHLAGVCESVAAAAHD